MGGWEDEGWEDGRMGPPGFGLNVREESWAEGGATTHAADEHKHCERADLKPH